jgi:hypothetical protein
LQNPNVTHYDSLLDAELASLRGEEFDARKHYEVAILYAGRRGLTQDRALGHERYGEHLIRMGADYRQDAEYQIGEALKLYDEWGAHAKVRRMVKVHEKYHLPPNEIRLRSEIY